MRIKVHRSLCEGHAVCRRFAPTVYQLDEEGYLDLHLVEVPPELERDARFGGTACPALAISIIETASESEPELASESDPESAVDRDELDASRS